jgi:hypothetical protein
MSITSDSPGFVSANDLDIYVEQVGAGPDVLLIGGLGDTVESWQFQLDGLADRYRLTAFDNRGAGRTAMPPGPVSVVGVTVRCRPTGPDPRQGWSGCRDLNPASLSQDVQACPPLWARPAYLPWECAATSRSMRTVCEQTVSKCAQRGPGMPSPQQERLRY